MKIQPYLFFRGNCKEAFEFYEQSIGGKITERHSYDDMPPQDEANTDDKYKPLPGRVMHERLDVNGQVLMGSDYPNDDAPEAIQGFRINLDFDNVEQARGVFNALSEDGEILMPFGKTFWSEGFAMFTDKYGVHWMVNAANHPPVY